MCHTTMDRPLVIQRSLLFLLFVLLTMLLAGSARLLAMAGTDQLIGEYDAIQKRDHWAKGIHELLLDPSRKVGWQSWFTELPNDLEQYAFAVRTTADAQRLIDLLANVEAAQRLVVLDPGRGPRGLGDWRDKAHGREWGAELSFGDPAALRHWFNQLHVDPDGKRRFGKMIMEAAPAAAPPTLTIHLGTANVDPGALKFPKNVSVEIRKSSQWPGRDYEEQVEKLNALAASRSAKVKEAK
jgi:hypothetical protein